MSFEIVTRARSRALKLCRSDQGDGGWSLHPLASKGNEDGADILAYGPATWDEAYDDWDRPNAADFEKAYKAFERMEKEASA